MERFKADLARATGSGPEPLLELTIAMAGPRIKASYGVPFVITFHNRSPDQFAFGDSTNDLLLNGGELLGNGAQVWSNVAAEIKSEAGVAIPVELHWGVPGVAGRVYFLGVPLRAGSSYQLAVRARDFMIGSDETLKSGKYEMRCVFHGRQSAYRDATQMPACWEGEVWSNTLKFEVVPD